VKGREEATAAAEDLGWPIVIKSGLRTLAHKSGLGLVRTGVADPVELSVAATAIAELSGSDELLVQQMVRGDVEALVGLVTESRLGRFVVVGLGGVFAEQLQDVGLAPLAADAEELRDVVLSTRLGAVLSSERWPRPGVVDDLVALLRRLADFGQAAGDDLYAVDVNPLIFTQRGPVAVDALIVPSIAGH
jgi:hypothetical protein